MQKGQPEVQQEDNLYIIGDHYCDEHDDVFVNF
jgi:hypothetical protein